MPDALETLTNMVPDTDLPVPNQPHSFREDAVMERHKDGFLPKPEPEPEVKEPPKQEEKTPPSDIPPEILGITTPKQEEPDLLTEEPKGQLKNENYKKLQAHAKARIEAEQSEKAKIKAELDEVRSKLSADHVPEKVQKQLEDYRAKLQEREEELGKLAVERSPMFKERFTSKQEALSKQLQKTASDLGLEKDIAAQLLRAEGKRRFDLIDDLEINTAAKGYITQLLQQHDQVEDEKSAFLENWKEKKAEQDLADQQKSDADKARQKEYEDRVFSTKLEEMAKTFAPLRKIEGNDTWNAQVDESIALAKRFYDGQFTNEEFSEIVLAGVGAQRLNAINSKLLESYNAMAKEVSALKAANPKAPPPGTKTPVEDDSKLSAEERYKRTFDRFRASADNNGFR